MNDDFLSRHGFLLIVSGPSGAGKSTVLHAVMENREDMFFSVSATTRAPREGEKHGVHYYFLSREEFVKDRDDGRFLEWAEFAGDLYGTPREPVIEQIKQGHIVVLDVETKGARQVMENYPEAISVYLTPSSVKVLVTRLKNRGTETEDKIRRRMIFNREGYAHIKRYDYIVVNDTLREAIAQFEAILLAEQHRTERLPELVKRIRTETEV